MEISLFTAFCVILSNFVGTRSIMFIFYIMLFFIVTVTLYACYIFYVLYDFAK